VYADEVLTAFRESAKARSEKSVAKLAQRHFGNSAPTSSVDGDGKTSNNDANQPNNKETVKKRKVEAADQTSNTVTKKATKKKQGKKSKGKKLKKKK
jgi:hypothetical protein